MQKYLFLIIALSSISFVSCGDRQVAALLDSAQELYDSEQYEAADSVLQTIDAATLQSGSKQQARYALLYTKTLYKNYIVSPSDSLINIVVDYAEAKGDDADRFYAYLYQGIVRYELGDYSKATQSLLRAMANSDDVEDHYSKGQMYMYLSLVNGEFKCSDEYYYAEKAYQEYQKGNLKSYAVNAMAQMGQSKLLYGDEDSCRIWLDSCLVLREDITSDYLIDDIMSAKAYYYVLIDSLSLADSIYQQLFSKELYSPKYQDIMNLSIINAEMGNLAIANDYLVKLQKMEQQSGSRINYYTAAFRVSRITENYEKAMIYEDSILNNLNIEYAKAIQHSSNAYQRDYSEMQLYLTNENNRRKRFVILSLLSIIASLLCSFVLYYRKNQLRAQLQYEKYEALKLELNHRTEKDANVLLTLQTSESVSRLHDIANGRVSAKVDWNEIARIFDENLPYFEKSLRKLYALTEIEWKVSMLIKLGFKPSEMAALLNHTSNGISNIRSRLYKKVFCQKGSPSDWDSFIENL